MGHAKKLFFWIAGILGILFILLGVILLLLPYFINLGPVREKVEAGISQHIGGQLEFQKIDLSFFPRPRIIIRQVRVSIPDNVTATLEVLTVVPQIIPLLRGKVRISLVQAEAPTITLELPGKSPEKEKPVLFSPAILEESLAPLLKLMESKAPQVTMEVEKGRLNLLEKKQSVFWFQNIQGRITAPPDQFQADLTCTSNLWRNMSIAARLSSKDLNGNVDIQMTDSHPHVLLNYLAPSPPSHLGDSRVNLKISLEISQGKAFRGKLQGSSPSLSVQQGEKKWSLKGITLNGDFQMQGEKAAFSLAELSLQNPRARFSGELSFDLAVPLFRLEIVGREMDVSPVREIALGLAGKTEPMQTIFDIVRGGRVPHISFKTHGRSPAELGDLKNLSIRGTMVGGRIFLSEALTGLKGIDFDFTNVRGKAIISGGILEGQNLAAQWEKSLVSQGSLKVGLEGGDAPFHLEALAAVDLIQLPPFLKNLIGDQSFSEEMDRFQELQGRVRARLTLGENLKSVQPRIEVEELSLLTRYERIPYPLKIESGQGAYEGGKIEVKNLTGAAGQSSFSDISAQINLKGAPYIILPSGKASIVLEEIFAWLTSIEKLKAPLQDIKSLKGTVILSSINLKGPLTQPGKWDYRLAGEMGTLAARYDPLPYPLQVEKAQVSFDGKKIDVQNLNGAMGKSSFSDISAQINLEENPYIVVPSGSSSIVLEELFAWLTSVERFKGPLQDIKSLTGIMVLSSIRLNGPLTQPEKWDYRLDGEVEKLALEALFLPGPLKVTAGKFEVSPEKILLQDSRVNLLDASLVVSAAGNGWQQGLGSFEGTFRGNVGAEMMEWSSARFLPLPENRRIQSPLSISRARLGWGRQEGISFAGDCQWPKGPEASIDLFYTPEVLTIRRLLITDDHSQANIGLKLQSKELHLNFKGNLEKTTVDRILVKNDLLAGSIQGDFQSHLVIDDPLRSTARGRLAGAGLGLILPVEGPLILESFSLDADRNKIRVPAAALRWEDRHLALEGSVDFSTNAFLLDLDVAIDGLQWAKIEKILKPEGEKTQSLQDEKAVQKTGPAKAGKTQFPPLRGRIGIKTPYFEYEKFTWKPLLLEITFPPEGVNVTVREAHICGISTPGAVRITSNDIALDFQILAKNQEISSSMECLIGNPFYLSGDLSIHGQIKGQGPAQDLTQSLQGPLVLEAKNGRVFGESFVIRILAALNLAELFQKDRRDLTKGEMLYKTFQAKGELRSGKILIRELVMDASVMMLASEGEIDFLNQRIDLVIALAPLKTVDWIIKHIPVVGYILGGTLISIPVRVHGDWNLPAIIPLAPSAIGSGLMGIMKRTLKLPFKVIQPLITDIEKPN